MVLPKKVSRKLRKVSRKFRKDKKTGKKLKGGSGRGKSGKSRMTSEEAKIASLGREARETIKKQNELGNQLATMFNINNTGLNNELYKLNLEEKIIKNKNLITNANKAKEKLIIDEKIINTDIQNLSDEIKNLGLQKEEIESKPSVNENNTSRINVIDALIEEKEEIKKKKEEEIKKIKINKQNLLTIIAKLQKNKTQHKEEEKQLKEKKISSSAKTHSTGKKKKLNRTPPPSGAAAAGPASRTSKTPRTHSTAIRTNSTSAGPAAAAERTTGAAKKNLNSNINYTSVNIKNIPNHRQCEKNEEKLRTKQRKKNNTNCVILGGMRGGALTL